jgi:AcrR family transcriptional regulator
VSRRDDILEAARILFAEKGFDGTTMRAVASSAGVDVALAAYHFGGKDGLFAAAMDLPLSPADVIGDVFAQGLDGAGERLVRTFLTVWETPETGAALLAVFRSAASNERASAAFGQFVSHGILRRYQEAIPGPDSSRRASLAATQLVGLALLRFVLRVEPLAGMPRDQVVAEVGPLLQRLLTGGLDPDLPVR